MIINDVNLLIHNVAHTYHTNLTKFDPQSNYDLSSTDDTHQTNHFSSHQIYKTDPSTSFLTSSFSLNIVQFICCTSKTQQFYWVNINTVMLLTKTMFQNLPRFKIHFKPNAHLITQRFSKVPLPCRDDSTIVLKN